MPNIQSLYNDQALLYDKLYSYKDYAGEAAFIKSLCNTRSALKPKMLDLACGTGSHLQYFEKWFQTTAVDLNPGVVKIASKRCKNTSFVISDLASLDFSQLGSDYMLITCLFSSIQYITNPSDVATVFKQVHKLLRKNGKLVFDLRYAKEHWQPGHTVTSTYKDDEIEIAMFGESFLNNSIAKWEPALFWKQKGKQHFLVDDPHTIRVYSVTEINTILRETGFKVKLYAGFSAKPYDKVSTPVFEATK
jgi:SAM-dependent methyltransferase